MNLITTLSLFASMAVLAAIPSVSVLAVASRSAASGFAHGAATSLGIVVGDIIFILVAILGLSLLADALGPAFFLVKYAAAAYLVWIGIMLWRSAGRDVSIQRSREATLNSSFLAGLLITLGDQKAILFYLGFFPAFLDLASISPLEVGMVIAITVVAVGGVKLVYAWLGDRARLLLGAGVGNVMNRIAGALMIAAALFMILVK